MIISRVSLQQAAADIRGVEATLTRIVRELHDAGTWSGADAERFQQEWEDQVRARLLGAAGQLDAVALIAVV